MITKQKIERSWKKTDCKKKVYQVMKTFSYNLINRLVGIYKPNVFLNFNEINDILTFVTWGSSFYLQRSSNLQAKLLL